MSLIGVACLVAAMLIASVVRTRQRLARLETSLRRLRAIAMRDIALRPLAAGELDVAALDGLADQLRGLGLAILGDAIEDSGPDGKHPTRWFADTAGTTFGFVGIARTARTGFMVSTSPERVALTRVVPRPLPSLAQPPFIDRGELYGETSGFAGPRSDAQRCAEWIDKLGEALAAHRTRVPANAAKVATLDDALREMRALRTRTIAWREAEPPDTLLDRDLRAMLGRHYDRLGHIMARRFGIRLPEARINR